MTSTLDAPTVTRLPVARPELPQRRKRPLTHDHLAGKVCRFCEIEFPAGASIESLGEGNGYRCEDRMACHKQRSALYATGGGGGMTSTLQAPTVDLDDVIDPERTTGAESFEP